MPEYNGRLYVSKFMSNKQSSVCLALPFPLDTIEASDEVSDQFQTPRRDMFGMQVCRLVFFRYTGVVCIQEPLPETLHTHISYIPILDSFSFINVENKCER